MQLLLTLPSAATLLSLVVLGLLFTPPVVPYCRGLTRAPPPATRRPSQQHLHALRTPATAEHRTQEEQR